MTILKYLNVIHILLFKNYFAVIIPMSQLKMYLLTTCARLQGVKR